VAIDKLMGLGVKSQKILSEIGIVDDDDFLSADPFELYQKLKEAGYAVSLNLVYGMIGAQENKHWQDVKREQRTNILFRLDDMGLAPKKYL